MIHALSYPILLWSILNGVLTADTSLGQEHIKCAQNVFTTLIVMQCTNLTVHCIFCPSLVLTGST